MKKIKAFNNLKNIFLLLIVICLILFNTGCGLDTFYYIDAPKQIGNIPEVNNLGVDSKVFQFDTIENGDFSDFSITGTDVYYKIYSDESKWKYEKDSLISLIKDGTNSADKLIGANGYGYSFQQLKISDSKDNVLIPFTGISRNVKLRLTNFSDISAYSAFVRIDGNNVGVPVRVNGKTFDFGRNNGNNKPLLDDPDVEGSKIPSNNKWFVTLFAVAKGHDAAYTNYFSNISYLGSVIIDSSTADN